MSNHTLQIHTLEQKILHVRGHKVMLDSHLAELYGVPTHRLNEQVKRNLKRFPPDFMFQLTRDEVEFLISQFAISKAPARKDGRGGRRSAPYVFTQEGIAMLSSVLKSERAVEVNIHIMRAFVKIREWLLNHRDLQEKIKKLERKFNKKFVVVFKAIQLLLSGPSKEIKVRGFAK